MANIDSPAQPKPGTYLFEVPGKRASVYVSLDLVDRLQQDVMRGFGAVPKRGAEVGGILLGSARKTDRLVVELDDYEMVVIQYKRGPSYQLSPGDLELFEQTLAKLRGAPEGGLKPVGFFRSNTRESDGLVPDDIELLDKYFPEPTTVVLLIKPYATKVGTATILVRENGAFPSGAPTLEFPFRRKDLAPGDETVSSRRRVTEDGSSPVVAPGPGGFASGPRANSVRAAPAAPVDIPNAEEEFSESQGDQAKAKGTTGWIWVPLSFIFLLLGVLLGFQAASLLRPQAAAGSDPYNLQLTVSNEGDNLNVRWDRQGLAVRSASRGVLVIEDGTYSKKVELDSNQLQTGSVVYRHSSGEVRFRFEVYPHERDMITETVNWKQ